VPEALSAPGIYFMKRMLFNATQAEELRVAIVDGQKLIDIDIESANKEQRKSNIYKGVITRVEPSLEAAFVDYGTERHGFLPFKEIARAYFKNPDADPARVRIQDALKEGQELIVQVDKDERGTKGAALTTFISLAGRYLVLMPNNPRGGGVSRRVEGDERTELRDAVSQLEVPGGMSIIARTAGIGRTTEELQWDLNYLMQLWQAIESASKLQSGAYLIYQESSLVIRAIRDYFQPDIGELLIDTEAIYEQAQQFMSHVMPGNVQRVKLYTDDVPLFSRFQIEHQIETAYARQVGLPSGGAIVIDHTEALVSVDVNSARATKGGDIETTAFNTNLEAAEEIARQMRLRDLGGLIVIDFIDMESQKNQREVENRLRDALKYDRARVQLGKISRFGLMELSRQRLRPSLGESVHIACPRCHGIGHIRGVESTALHILRIMQEEAMKENTAQIVAQVPVDVSSFLLNEKRSEIHSIEARFKVAVVVVPNVHLETPNYSVTRLRHEDLNQAEPLPASFQMVEKPPEEDLAAQRKEEAQQVRPEAAVKGITPAQPAPIIVPPSRPGLFSKILGWLRGEPEAAPPKLPVKTDKFRDHRGRRHEKHGEPRDDKRGEQRQGGRERRPQEQGKQAQQNAPRDRRPGAPAGGQQQPEGQQPRRERQQQRPPKQQQKPQEPRPERAQVAPPVLDGEGTPAIEAGGPVVGEQKESSRRRRGGRNRRERGERTERGERGDHGEQRLPQAEEKADAAPEREIQPAPASTPAWEPSPTLPATPPPIAEVAPQREPAMPTQAPVAPPPPAEAPRVAAETYRAPQPVVTPPPIVAPPPAKPYVLPPDSGLVLVETQHVAAPAAEPPPAQTPQQRRRARPAPVEEQAEPLVLIETKKD
jgi:ribonuclease E